MNKIGFNAPAAQRSNALRFTGQTEQITKGFEAAKELGINLAEADSFLKRNFMNTERSESILTDIANSGQLGQFEAKAKKLGEKGIFRLLGEISARKLSDIFNIEISPNIKEMTALSLNKALETKYLVPPLKDKCNNIIPASELQDLGPKNIEEIAEGIGSKLL